MITDTEMGSLVPEIPAITSSSAPSRRDGMGRRLLHWAVVPVFVGLFSDPGLAAERKLEKSSSPPNPACAIKGNVNSKGERIYHPPSGQMYDKTQVILSQGDKWFCTEKEAEAAGFRASKR